MNRSDRRRIWLWAGMAASAALAISGAAAAEDQAGAQSSPSAAPKAFRVCADPNNLPFSNEAKAGFENKLADLFAAELHEPVTYAWHAQRRGFVRQTLKARLCDVVMGMPTKLDMIEPTKPYYRSTYVFVSRADAHLGIQSIKDPRLQALRIGVQLIGDDGFNTPPAHALSAQGIVNNVVGYTVYGDYTKPNPPAEIIAAVERGDVDIAAVWGPLAGYFAGKSKIPLTVTPITDTESFAPLMFGYDISLAVRKGDHARKVQLDEIIDRKRPQIEALLASYRIPTLPLGPEQSKAEGRRSDLRR